MIKKSAVELARKKLFATPGDYLIELKQLFQVSLNIMSTKQVPEFQFQIAMYRNLGP